MKMDLEKKFPPCKRRRPKPKKPLPAEEPSTPGEMAGIPAAPGVATGPLEHYRPNPLPVSPDPAENPPAELARLQDALVAVQDDLRTQYAWAARRLGQNEAAIFEAHILLLEDPALIEDARRRILSGHMNAGNAWNAAIEVAADGLGRLNDDYLSARAADLRDLSRQVLIKLAGGSVQVFQPSRPVILAANDLSPSEIRGMDARLVLGICLAGGSPTSHSMILARGMGIPAIVGLGSGLASLPDGTPAGFDGQQGRLWVAPSPERLDDLEKRRADWLETRRNARAGRGLPCSTRDGRRIPVLANIAGLEDTQAALENGAEGVGLLRTEFLFLDRRAAPTEDEQVEAYQSIAAVLGDAPLVIRTLDIGGDKALPYMPVPREDNPFLGLRGLRLSLTLRDLFKTQLRAILRASPGHNIRIMFPMVSVPAEISNAKEILAEVQGELRSAGLPFDEMIRTGIMVETPAAAAIADQLAPLVDFFSIGSNDLSQYVMAADRTNPYVAPLATAYQPAVLRTIQAVIQTAHQYHLDVALCGELASDPLAAPVLLGLGLDEFSANPAAVSLIKQAIGRLGLAECQAIARTALDLDSAEKVRLYLQKVNSKAVN